MIEPSIMKVAQAILDENRHLVTFEVDPLDARAADLLAEALQSYGCMVEKDRFSTRLIVHCPETVGQANGASS